MCTPYDYPLYKFGRHIFGNARNFNYVLENLSVPSNRIYHSQREKENTAPICLNKYNIFIFSYNM